MRTVLRLAATISATLAHSPPPGGPDRHSVAAPKSSTVLGHLIAIAQLLQGAAAPPLAGQNVATCRSPTIQSIPQQLPHLGGRWDLVVAADGRKPASLTLTLVATDSVERIGTSILTGKPHYDPNYLFRGTLIGDARDHEMGVLNDTTTDPERPSVKGEFRTDPTPIFSLSIGSDANDRTVLMVDGYRIWLQAALIRDTLMSGTWVAGVHSVGWLQGGWWCARRAGSR